MLANEKLSNFEWETRVEAERLAAAEARILLEFKLRNLSTLNHEALDAQVKLAATTLARIQARYRAMTDRQEKDLVRLAQNGGLGPRRLTIPSKDTRPVEGPTLSLEASWSTFRSWWPRPLSRSIEEQRGLADEAERDFASIQHLLDDGKISHLDALRFNNNFRKIGPLRAKIISHGLPPPRAQSAYYENAQ